MQPGQAVGYEAFQVQRGGDRAGVARGAAVGEVGEVGVEHLAIGAPQRQPPQRIGHRRAGGQRGLGQRIVVAEQRRQVRSQRHARGAGEGGEVDHQIRLLLGAVGHRVAQHQAALGVGVVDLHAVAGAGDHHFAGAQRVAAHRVLHRGHQQGEPHRQLRLHHQPGQCDRVRGAAHVLLHPAHAVGGLEVEAAGVEAHALAHEHQLRVIRLAPAQFEQPRRAVAGAAHRVDGGEVRRKQFVADPCAQLGLVCLAELLDRRAELLGAHVLGGRVDQVAHQRGGVGQRLHRGQRGGVQRERGRRVLRLAVAGELVGAQRPAQRGLHRVERHAFRGELVDAGGQRGRQAGERAQRVGRVHAHQHAGGLALRIGEQQGAAGPGLEAVRIQPAPLRGIQPLLRAGEVAGVGGLDRDAMAGGGGAVEQGWHGWPRVAYGLGKRQ